MGDSYGELLERKEVELNFGKNLLGTKHAMPPEDGYLEFCRWCMFVSCRLRIED